MSHGKEKDLLPLLVILESTGKIKIYSEDFNDAALFFQCDDQAKFNASLLLLINIGEQSLRLSSNLRTEHSYLPFDAMRGLRNRIAHDYTGIDYEMVFDIIKNDISVLELQLKALLKVEIAKGTFDMGELAAARHSPFYKHINFDSLIS
jgi:uncharacterized protein with HEPN domain